MFNSSDDQNRTRIRLGLAEALLVAAILVFAGFTLIGEGRQSLGALLAGVTDTFGG